MSPLLKTATKEYEEIRSLLHLDDADVWIVCEKKYLEERERENATGCIS